MIRFILYILLALYLLYALKNILRVFQDKKRQPPKPTSNPSSLKNPFPPTEIKDAEFKEVK
ncbi:MAG: hypothetical protein KGZ58_13380 [Ignavibacteriales bacterium]|nr:hypothetical protein [Ignavibacteriales bacterium]